MNSRELLIETLTFMPPARLLQGLNPAGAEQVLPGAPHSIAQILAHLSFWQDWFIGRAQGSGEAMAATASLGWPAVAIGTWPEIHRHFLEGLDLAAALDTTSAIEPPFDFPPMSHYTAGDVVVHLANHNAHHLGQVLLLRQCAGLWPPPAGSWTW